MKRSIALIILLTNFFACKKFVDPGVPKTMLTTATIFSSDVLAEAVMTGIYAHLATGGFAGGDYFSGISFVSGVSSDEFTNYDNYKEQFYRCNINPAANPSLNEVWKTPYTAIYNTNALLEGLDASTAITGPVKERLTGEAKFIRAFAYFYLVNLFGDVPLHLTTDYRANAQASKTERAKIYHQIISDLEDAKQLLPEAYPTGQRIKPNKAVAVALLARVYLYTRDWEKAEAAATGVIDNSAYSLLPDLQNVFLKNSGEAIWQLMPTQQGYNTWEGYFFAIVSNPAAAGQITLSEALLQAFEPGDARKTNWTNSYTEGSNTWYYPYKYKVSEYNAPLTEYSMVLRLAEQYLIRAEARAQQNKLADAISDIDSVRHRAQLPLIHDTDPGIGKEALLEAILHEKMTELFSEWGHRWLDLKRTQKADEVLKDLKAPNWQLDDTLYPIPQDEILNNPRITQNKGYN